MGAKLSLTIFVTLGASVSVFALSLVLVSIVHVQVGSRTSPTSLLAIFAVFFRAGLASGGKMRFGVEAWELAEMFVVAFHLTRRSGWKLKAPDYYFRKSPIQDFKTPTVPLLIKKSKCHCLYSNQGLLFVISNAHHYLKLTYDKYSNYQQLY